MDQADASDTHTFSWNWQGVPVHVNYEVRGHGLAILLLPPFSTVSSREEMARLAEELSGSRRTITTDWPGFGRSGGPALQHSPALHLAFLQAFVEEVAGTPCAVVAAGHAAAYALQLAQHRPNVWSSIVLAAPTWRGPLPTMMGGRRPAQDRILAAIRAPVLGPALYRLNVSRPVIGMMYRRHVYTDPGRVTPEFVARKAAVAQRPGGRFGSGAFVTGALDAVADREAFLALARAAAAPKLLLYGPQTPPRSKLEMEALAAEPGIYTTCLNAGSLGVCEEHPASVATAIARFLSAAGSGSPMAS